MAVDIIARGMITNYTAGTNINLTEKDDGTVEISASGDVSSEDTFARDMINNHTANKENPHKVTAEQIGLDNVDNTSDVDKPVSTATQQALDKKAEKTHTHKKSDITDFPNSLPANGGNADTVDGYHVSELMSIVEGEVYNSFARIDIDNNVIKNYDAGQLQVGSANYATNAGNANTVNNHTVEADVPADALFTDTVYDDTEIDNRVTNNTDNISQLFDITKGGETVTGNSSYTIENAVDYPIMGINVYGKSIQGGAPTPENPVNIVSVGDSGSIEIETCGKNLFDLSKCNWKTKEFNGLSFTRNDNGEILVNGTATAATTVIFTSDIMQGKITSGQLIITGCPQTGVGGGICRLQFYYNTPSLGSKQIWQSNSVEATITLPSDYTDYNCSIVINSGFTANNLVFKPMLRIATITDSTFEPYKGNTASITSALPLCGIPVSSGGNYTDSNGQQWICDELIYNADGSGKITKHTAKIDSYNSEDISTPYISTTGSLTTGATVVYALAEPQEIQLTAAEMTALRQLQTFNGTTSISNSSGTEMNVKYCTNKALSEFAYPVTMGLQKQIDELRAAILSMGGNV